MNTEHATLSKEVFSLAIKDLKLFYSSFKPSEPQIIAWFSRLRFFDDDDLRLAVYEITQERSETPTYQLLLKELWKAHHKRKPRFHPMVKPTELQAVAEPSDAKKDLCSSYMRMLFEALSKPKEKRESEFTSIKRGWVESFRALPGYQSRETVKRTIEAEDVETLAKWQILNLSWQEKKKLFIPPLESEKQKGMHHKTSNMEVVVNENY